MLDSFHEVRFSTYEFRYYTLFFDFDLSFFKFFSNPKAAKEQEGKSGKDGNVIKLKSLNSKSENNPVHPLFLKRDRMDIEKVSKIAVPSDKISTPGKQIKKNNLKYV